MQIYSVNKSINEYEVDENDLFNFLKSRYSQYEDVKNISSLKELIDLFGCLDEFDKDIKDYLGINKINGTCIENWEAYFKEYGDACMNYND